MLHPYSRRVCCVHFVPSYRAWELIGPTSQGPRTSPALLSSHSSSVLRRVIKPFSVEFRSTTRRTRLEHPNLPVWPDLTEQPIVEWPEALVALAADVEPVQEAGRVLPDLSEAETARRRQIEAQEPAAPLAEELADISPQAIVETGSDTADPEQLEIEAAVEPVEPRQGRKRFEREEFRRGERWKARLPIAAHGFRLKAVSKGRIS